MKKAIRKARAVVAAKETQPVTLDEVRKMIQPVAKVSRAMKRKTATPEVSTATVAVERRKLERERRRERMKRVSEYKAMMGIMKKRGVKGLPTGETVVTARGGRGISKRTASTPPLQIFAEGDSWFDYPVPFFGGGIIPRLEDRIGVPILNLAKAGDEVRFMLGVEERMVLEKHLREGCPAGGSWDVLLFSGGGNDIVDNPMALWVKDYQAGVPGKQLIEQGRFDAALGLVRAGYEDLITLRDKFSPNTELVFHCYDYAIPDGRGVCFLGPWLRPTFDLRKFPRNTDTAFEVVKEMLQQFAHLLEGIQAAHKGVTFINTQGKLAPNPKSWHNELHPSKAGFELFADVFHAKLKELFPSRVL